MGAIRFLSHADINEHFFKNYQRKLAGNAERCRFRSINTENVIPNFGNKNLQLRYCFAAFYLEFEKMSTNSGATSKNRAILKSSLIKEDLQDDGGLLSLEKLDRTSPDLWPEKIPGITDFIAMSDTPIRTPAPEWSRGISQEDITAMLQLSALPANGLIMEIKKIYDEAYQLGVSEAKEMTRGKYLGIFNNAKKKSI